jgi:hypothetical protein
MAKTLTGVHFSIACLALLCCCVRIDFAQDGPADSAALPLTLPLGTPLYVVLMKTIPINHAGVHVEGKVVENVYVFDHLVIPKGSRVMGQVTEVDNAPRKERALAIANGHFTPLRQAHMDFDTLVKADGTRIPLQTNVLQGAPRMVHIVAGGNEKEKKAREPNTVNQIYHHFSNQEKAAIKRVTSPGKMQRLKAAFIASLPYHRPVLKVGTYFTAELKVPLTLGTEIPPPKPLETTRREIPSGSLVHIRLVSPLSSATARPDTPVCGVVWEPLFSADHALILPEGAQVTGTVTQVLPARRFGRSGQVRFVFRELRVPSGSVQKIQASVQGIDAASQADLQLDAEGGVHAVPPNYYALTGLEIFLAATPLNLSGGRHGFHPGSAQHHNVDYPKAAIKGTLGMGLAGAIVTIVAHSRPVSTAFASYGVGWRVYSHFLARGENVVLPRNTLMDIRFGIHNDSAPAPLGHPSGPSVAKPDETED